MGMEPEGYGLKVPNLCSGGSLMDPNMIALTKVANLGKKIDRIRFRATGGKYGHIPVRRKSTKIRNTAAKKDDANAGFQGGTDSANAG